MPRPWPRAMSSRGVALLEKFSKTNERDRFVADLAASLGRRREGRVVAERRAALVCRGRPHAVGLPDRGQTARGGGAAAREHRLSSGRRWRRGARPTAFGWLAVAIAPRDKALAYSLIDRGLRILLAPSDRRMSSQRRPARPRGGPGRAGPADRLSRHGKRDLPRVGHPGHRQHERLSVSRSWCRNAT